MKVQSNGKKLDAVPWRSMLYALLFFALLTRLVIGMGYINRYDTEWNIMWAVELGDGFFSAYAHVTSLDYPPLYLYPLYVVGRLIEVEGIGGYPPFRMLAIKLFPCLADTLTCGLLWLMGEKKSRALGLFAAAVWAVNPAAIFNCAFWGQTDCVMLCLAALVWYLLSEKKLIAAGAVFAALCTTKLQGLYLAPVVGMEVLSLAFGSLHIKTFRLRQLNRVGWRRFGQFVGGFGAAAAAVFVPFMMGAKSFIMPLSVYWSGLGKYPYCSLNADNFYALFGLNSVKDSMLTPLGFSVSALGTIFLLLSVLLVVYVYLFGKRRSHWLAGYMLMECIFMLTCRQHERYQIITLILLAGALLERKDKRLLPMLCGQTFVIFVNQARVLGVVHDGRETSWYADYSALVMLNSLLNAALFVVTMTFVLRYYFDEQWELPFAQRVKGWAEHALSFH